MLCMIAEYHMACMTRDSPVTSPIVLRGLEERLPPLADYAPPKDRSGTTDVRIRDHQARTLQVAVLCHQLDMALSEEPASSGSLVRSDIGLETSWPTSSALGLPGSYDSRT